MASYSHTRLIYKAKVDGKNYIDVSRGMALVNGKNCSQFDSKDRPQLFLCSARLSTSSETLRVAKNSWMVRNSCVKAAAAWRRTLRSAGIRSKKKLNTYARNPRFAFNEGHSAVWSALGSSDADIIPQDVPVSYKTGIMRSSTGASGGTATEVQVFAYNEDTTLSPWSATNVQAFTQTTFAVPQSGSTDVLDKPANLLGALSTTASNVVAEYIDSRINDAEIEDTDMAESPSNDNDFVMMLAPGEEVADDVLDNIDDEGKWRPYSMDTSNTAISCVVAGANVSGQDTLIEAPLGLIEWKAGSICRRWCKWVEHSLSMDR